MKIVPCNECTAVAWKDDYGIHCHLYMPHGKQKFLSLRECNDGSKFTSVNQAINQAKEFVQVIKHHEWNAET